ncbi:MAG: hypothetical protein ACIAS6_04930 [Phycisphaerales bacterium JB060]
MATSVQNQCKHNRRPLAVFLGRSGFGLALAVLLFTALIWLRLRLVTDVPRRAYAHPETDAKRVDKPSVRDGVSERAPSQ